MVKDAEGTPSGRDFPVQWRAPRSNNVGYQKDEESIPMRATQLQMQTGQG